MKQLLLLGFLGPENEGIIMCRNTDSYSISYQKTRHILNDDAMCAFSEPTGILKHCLGEFWHFKFRRIFAYFPKELRKIEKRFDIDCLNEARRCSSCWPEVLTSEKKPTQWSRVAHSYSAIMKYSAIIRTGKFTTLFTNPCNWFLSWAR